MRLLGLFQADHPTRVPERAVDFVADQLHVDPGVLPECRAREKTAYEHAWQIREAFGDREFADGEQDLRAYLAARVWAGEEGPRALFDRAVLYLLEHQILLPGLTVLSRLVRQIRKEENARLHQVLNERIPHPVRAELTGGSWKRPIYANPDLEADRIDKAAFLTCVIEHLHRALKRRDVFARGGNRWGDPRARLDLPDLLMEVDARTGFTNAFTHYSGAETGVEDFSTSVGALLVAEACNIGLTPVAKDESP